MHCRAEARSLDLSLAGSMVRRLGFILAEVAFGRLHSSTEGHSSSQGGPLSMTLPVLGPFK